LPEETVIRVVDRDPVLRVAYELALRVSELLLLRRDEYNPETGVIAVYRLKHKGKPNRYILQLSDETRELLNEYIESNPCPDGRIFCMSRKAIQLRFKKALARTGIDPDRYTFHVLRHCLHPDTRIVVPEGILPAKLLYFRHSPVVSLNFDNMQLTIGEVSGKSMHIANKLLSIWAGGRELVCTPEHRLFRLRNGVIEEVQASELRVGDYIAGVRWVEVPNRNRVFEPKLWRLMGYVVGDGYVTKLGLSVSEKDERLIAYYTNLLKELGFSSHIRKEAVANAFRIEALSVALRDLARYLGLDSKSSHRRVPLELFHATDDEIKEFIAGFYDAEGSRIDEKSKYIRMFSTSKDLLKDIQMLLLYFGIHSYLSKRVRRVRLPQGKLLEHHVLYELRITDSEDVEKFARTVPTLKIDAAPKPKKPKSGDVIPVADVLKKIYERRVREGKKVLWLSKYMNVNPSRRTLARILKIIADEPETPFLRMLVEGNIRWFKVTKIEESGGWGGFVETKEVKVGHYITYDFEVPKYHTLITDGIISHNSRCTNIVINQLKNKGTADLIVLSKFMGHLSPNTTMMYVHIATKALGMEVPIKL